jgi:rhodanese-related sulfurtransferase
VLLIDTREPDEAAISPIPGTVNLPFSKVASALAEGNNPGTFQKVSRAEWRAEPF